MLVLSRKCDEAIVINDDIKVTVVEIRGDKVRLGIEAPAMVPVHRQEVYDAIKRNQGSLLAPKQMDIAGRKLETIAKPAPVLCGFCHHIICTCTHDKLR